MKIGDIVWTVETNYAILKHQPDGVDLLQGEIIENPENNSEGLFFLNTKLLYSVGKNSYSRKSGGFSKLKTRFQIPFPEKEVFENLNEAKKEMIIQLFEKESWLK